MKSCGWGPIRTSPRGLFTSYSGTSDSCPIVGRSDFVKRSGRNQNSWFLLRRNGMPGASPVTFHRRVALESDWRICGPECGAEDGRSSTRPSGLFAQWALRSCDKSTDVLFVPKHDEKSGEDPKEPNAWVILPRQSKTDQGQKSARTGE